MRPLTILIAAVALLGAILFGVLMLTGEHSGRGEGATSPRPRGPANPAPAQDLVAPERVATAVDRVASEVERAEVASATTVEARQPGGIFGVVVNPEDEPIAKARVLLLSVKSSAVSEAIQLVTDEELPEPVAEIVTDATGQFDFKTVAPGTWTVVVLHDIYNRYEANGIVVDDGAQVEERIVLEYGLSLTGYVHDALSGAPIAGATLQLVSPLALVPGKTRKPNPNDLATTDALGFFGFKNAGRGQKTLLISAPTYATQVHSNFGLSWGFKEHDPKDGPQIFRRNMAKQRRLEAKKPKEMHFELLPGKTIAGRVVGPNSAGISGIEVVAIDQSNNVGSRGTTVSTADGAFVVADLAEGKYTLQAIAQGYGSMPSHGVETDRTDVELRLAEHGSVSGRVVVAATGKPVPNFVVKVRALHPDNPSWGMVVARGDFRDRSNGRFSLSGVPDGDYVIEGSSRGFASSFSQTFSVVDGQETPDIRVPLTKGGTIRGLVVDGNGDPLPGAEVRTRDNNHVDSEFFEMLSGMSPSASTKGSVRTDQDGAFEIALMTPDVYQLVITKKGFSKTTLNDIAIGNDAVLEAGTIQLREGAVVRGRVFGPDNKPASGATVYLMPADENPWGGREARTDAKGNYVLDNAMAGAYKLNATRSASERGNPFTAIVDMRNSEIEISLVDGGSYEQDIHMASAKRAE